MFYRRDPWFYLVMYIIISDSYGKWAMSKWIKS